MLGAVVDWQLVANAIAITVMVYIGLIVAIAMILVLKDHGGESILAPSRGISGTGTTMSKSNDHVQR